MKVLTAAAAFTTLLVLPISLFASTSYTYDMVGRVTTAIYDNGMCVAYSYDATGNRTSQSNTIATAAETPIWGDGVWGCFQWAP